MGELKANNISKVENPKQELSVQQKALVSGMLGEVDDATTRYEMRGGQRYYRDIFREGDWEALVKKFKDDPKDCLALARNNLMSIMADRTVPEEERRSRVRRYVDSYFGLMIRLDRSAFPPSSEIGEGIPDYIPDGLSDFGSDRKPDPASRNREKIRVDKENIFAQSKEFFYEIFSKDFSGHDSEKMKKYFALRVAQFVYDKMPYNHYRQDELENSKKSVLLSDVAEKELAVCRHHALYSQVLFQSLGMATRLLKCDVSFDGGNRFGGHAVNLVRINNKWYLMDVTIPDQKDGKKVPFLQFVPDSDVDVNKKEYNWKFHRNDGKTYHYRSRNNMFYRINDNRKPL
jgi:hypothetical protein